MAINPQNSSGQNLDLIPGPWLNPENGEPFPAFRALIQGLINRTGGSIAPGSGGVIGLSALIAEISAANNTADLALAFSSLGLMDGGEPQPKALAVVAGDGLGAAALLFGGDELPAPVSRGLLRAVRSFGQI